MVSWQLAFLLWSVQGYKMYTQIVLTLQQTESRTQWKHKVAIAHAAKLCFSWNAKLEWDPGIAVAPIRRKESFSLNLQNEPRAQGFGVGFLFFIIFWPVRKYKLEVTDWGTPSEWKALSFTYPFIIIFMKPSKPGIRYLTPQPPILQPKSITSRHSCLFVLTCQVHGHRRFRTFSHEEVY